MSDLADKVSQLLSGQALRLKGPIAPLPERAIPVPVIAPPVPIPEQPAPDPWLHDYCGTPLTIEGVCKSDDGSRWLTLWHCNGCQSSGITPDEVKPPPPHLVAEHRDDVFLTDSREQADMLTDEKVAVQRCIEQDTFW